MISRRRFCLGSSALLACLPHVASARPAVKIFGIGGAGSNIVEQMRETPSLTSAVQLATVNRADERRAADMKFSSGFDGPLTPTESERILAAVDVDGLVVLVAGIGGRAGTNLTRHFTEAARRAGATVTAVLIWPFDYEGRRRAAAPQATSRIACFADRVRIFDNEWLMQYPDITMIAALKLIDTLVIKSIVAEIKRLPGLSFSGKESYR